MQLKSKIIAAITVCFVTIGTGLSVYNQEVVLPKAVSTQFDNQKDYIKVIYDAVKKHASAISESENQKYGPFFSKIKDRAFDKFQIDSNKQGLLDYTAFPYFAQSNADEQFFVTTQDIPDEENCLDMFKVPKQSHDTVLNNLKALNVNISSYWCKLAENKKFVGYRLHNDADKNFIYVRVINENLDYKDLNINQAISKIDVSEIINEDSVNSFAVMDPTKKVLLSSTDKFSSDEIPNEMFNAAREKKEIQFENKSDKVKLFTLIYDPEFDVFVSVQTPKGLLIKPAITGNFLLVGLCLLGLFGLIGFAVKNLENLRKDMNAISNNIDVVSTNILSDQSKMNEILSKVDKSKITFEPLTKIVSSVDGLGHSIVETVSGKIKELEEKDVEDCKNAAKLARIDLITTMHRDLMPSGKDMPNSKFLDIASFIMPSKENPSDFYDVFRVDQDNIGIVFGSCSKSDTKTISAISTCTTFVRNALVNDTRLPGETLTALNKLFALKPSDDFNISIFVMILSEFTGNFIYSVAGKKTPILVHLHKATVLEPKLMQSELCSTKDTVYIDSKGKFSYLDTLVFVGKGIDSVVNDKDEEFGMEKTLDICQLKSDESATDQLIALYKASKEFTGERENDVDICAILVKKNANNKEFEEV